MFRMKEKVMEFSRNVLDIDCQVISNALSSFISKQLTNFKRDGIVIGLSGGVDSALCARLCVNAIGIERVVGLMLPERESASISLEYAKSESENLGIKNEIVDISSTIESLGGYNLRDKVIKQYFPEFRDGYKSKIVLPGDILDRDSFNFFTLVIEDNMGNKRSTRLDNRGLRQIVASTNSKQRTRMLYLYRFAETHNYLVCGTTNRTENIQGYFVKYGDGGVDIEPIIQLYKSQVYQLAKFLGVSKEIIDREPSPDTFSLAVTDEEFYFRVPYDTLDLLLYAWEHNVPVAKACTVMGLDETQVRRVFRDFKAKYNITTHQRSMPPGAELMIGSTD